MLLEADEEDEHEAEGALVQAAKAIEFGVWRAFSDVGASIRDEREDRKSSLQARLPGVIQSLHVIFGGNTHEQNAIHIIVVTTTDLRSGAHSQR